VLERQVAAARRGDIPLVAEEWRGL